MGKALVGILETAVGIGLEFVPGGQAIGTSLILAGVSTTAAALLTKAPKPEVTETAVKKPIPERVSAYGRARRQRSYIQ